MYVFPCASACERTSIRTMLTSAVLVRRVVEARRLAAGDAPSAHPYRTAALPPPKANESSTDAPNEKNDDTEKESFWKKLKCW
jgi:GTPase KRas protein